MCSLVDIDECDIELNRTNKEYGHTSSDIRVVFKLVTTHVI